MTHVQPISKIHYNTWHLKSNGFVYFIIAKRIRPFASYEPLEVAFESKVKKCNSKFRHSANLASFNFLNHNSSLFRDKYRENLVSVVTRILLEATLSA